MTAEPPHHSFSDTSVDFYKQKHDKVLDRVFILAYFIGLKAGTEYGMGVTAVKDERESLPTTTNAVTGKSEIAMTTR